MDQAERSRIIDRYRGHSRRFDAIAERRGGRETIPLLPAPPAQSLKPPSKREIEVLQLVANGLSNHEIGEQLFMALETVKSHVRHLLSKLEARSRAHAVAAGFRRRLIK